jgi:hypothetical protein
MTFSVHPSAFVVHVPHKKAATFKVTKSSGQWDKVGTHAVAGTRVNALAGMRANGALSLRDECNAATLAASVTKMQDCVCCWVSVVEHAWTSHGQRAQFRG